MTLLFFLFAAQNHVADGIDRIVKQHPGAGKPHDLTDFFPHLRLIAMYLTIGAKSLCLHKRTFITAYFGISLQIFALQTQLCLGAAMTSLLVMSTAIDADHFRNNLFFPLSFLFCCLMSHHLSNKAGVTKTEEAISLLHGFFISCHYFSTSFLSSWLIWIS